MFQFDTDLNLLEIEEGDTIDWFHQEIYIWVTFEGRVELGETVGHQVLFSQILELTKNISFIEEMLDLFLFR